jgi:hypothetical protein
MILSTRFAPLGPGTSDRADLIRPGSTRMIESIAAMAGFLVLSRLPALSGINQRPFYVSASR